MIKLKLQLFGGRGSGGGRSGGGGKSGGAKTGGGKPETEIKETTAANGNTQLSLGGNTIELRNRIGEPPGNYDLYLKKSGQKRFTKVSEMMPGTTKSQAVESASVRLSQLSENWGKSWGMDQANMRLRRKATQKKNR